ncbi:MAG TPA: fibronectin type III domain-containing protein [Candidatus Paceibacterota bacterium]|nr:fibronectin type III domain-containing protein [Candidatus Paceibacterota bacterium]
MRKRIIFLIILSLFWGHTTLVSAAPVLSKKAPALVKDNASETIPIAPSGLTLELVDHGRSVALKWNDNALDETGFTIERNLLPYTGGEVWVEIATLGPNAVEYIDSKNSVPCHYWVQYRVKAYNTIGFSAPSNVETTNFCPMGKIYGYLRKPTFLNMGTNNVVITLKPHAYGYGTHDYVTNTDGSGYFEFNDIRRSVMSSGGQVTWIRYTLYINDMPVSPEIPLLDFFVVRHDIILE